LSTKDGCARFRPPVRSRPDAGAVGAVGGVAFDGGGNVYLASTGAHVIEKLGPSGERSGWAGRPAALASHDGVGEAASFQFPQAIAVDAQGNVFVADNALAIRKVAADGNTTTVVPRPADAWS
jgi:sugar lactone lactonase YvrE